MNRSNGPPPGSDVAALWTAEDVARYLNVSRSWVYHRAASGELPSLHVGPLVRFEPEAIRAFAHRDSAKGARILPFPPPGSRGRKE